MSEFMKRQAQASIGILELHDSLQKTEFPKEYNPDASSNRLGSVGAVNCNDCHAANVSGGSLLLAQRDRRLHTERAP
jgi:hypothetical protein